MRVPGTQNKRMLQDEGRDPHIVGRDGSALFPQLPENSAVMRSHQQSLSEITELIRERAESQLLRRFCACVPHIEHNLPAPVLLLFPDAGVLAMLNNHLAVFVLRAELEGAVGIA